MPESTSQEKTPSLEQQLVAIQRQAALGDMLSTTAHEFNNILMTIMNYARMGLRNPNPESREKSFRRILEATERAAEITGSVLGMASQRSDKFEATDLPKLAKGVLVLVGKEMQKYRVQVETDFSSVPEVPAIASQIQQVLLNLLVNARQAMSSGGTVVVKLVDSSSEGYVDLVVRDYGSGIPREHLPRIFENGFSTKKGPDESGKGGAGIGLAACRKIVEAHQGKIRVESSPGKGTAFTVRLPLTRKECENQTATAPPPLSSTTIPSTTATAR